MTKTQTGKDNARKAIKRAVAQSKAANRSDFYIKMENVTNDNEMLKLAKHRRHQIHDIGTDKCTKG